MRDTNDLRLAVLIDADNIPYANVKGIIEEIARYGTPTFKRIYGDWTKPNLSGWKTVLLDNAITPIQQYSYTSGKNSTDSAMIIDAMDIFYSGKADGFCIVSSDSDFTRLAIRLRESGMKVFGIGEKKTPSPFISACDKFIYIEIINAASEEKKDTPVFAGAKGVHKGGRNSSELPAAQELPTAQELPSSQKNSLIKLISTAINDLSEDDNGWAFLGDVGNLILKKQPDFDPRNYGNPKLTLLIKSLGAFEIDQRDSGNSNIKHVYIRLKR